MKLKEPTFTEEVSISFSSYTTSSRCMIHYLNKLYSIGSAVKVGTNHAQSGNKGNQIWNEQKAEPPPLP
jgi:hypothetical protein